MSEQGLHAGASATLCPSAQPDMHDPLIIGVVGGEGNERQIRYLNERVAATNEMLERAGPAPTRVLRLAAHCEERLCSHFDGSVCRLATRVAAMLDPVVDALPPCAIRRDCRWYAQEGRAACLRCPQVVTESANVSEPFRQVALGS